MNTSETARVISMFRGKSARKKPYSLLVVLLLAMVLAVGVAFVLCAGAYADIEAYVDCYYQPTVTPGADSHVPDFNDGTYYTIDLRVIVWDDDDWTSTSAWATIDSGEFFYHPVGSDTPPLAAFVELYPALEFDCFYCSTEADPDNQPPYGNPALGEGENEAQMRWGSWFDVPPSGGDGDFLLARYTVKALDEELPVTFHVWGSNTTYNGGGHLYPFELTCVIPEPASPALLGLGLVLVRRR